MKLKIDFEHIFFDRFELSDSEKEREAESIIREVFKNCAYLVKDGIVEITPKNIDDEMHVEKMADTLKKEFFILLSEEKVEAVPRKETPLEAMEKYIRKNLLYETLTVAEVCENAGITRSAADRLFLNAYGSTVSEYIKEKRVEKAQKLLKEGEKLKECADLCGFGSLKTMQRAFNAVCGMSPRQWQRHNLDTKGLK